jgi:hypothetical protein
MLIEDAALKELDDVHEFIDLSRIEDLLAGFHSIPAIVAKKPGHR